MDYALDSYYPSTTPAYGVLFMGSLCGFPIYGTPLSSLVGLCFGVLFLGVLLWFLFQVTFRFFRGFCGSLFRFHFWVPFLVPTLGSVFSCLLGTQKVNQIITIIISIIITILVMTTNPAFMVV